MTGTAAARQARLRGALTAEQLGSRGLEHMARNPSCGLLKGLTIAGVSPATVVEAIYGDPPREGQSPFALTAGNRFETQLFDSGAARLLELYRTRGRLGVTETSPVWTPLTRRLSSCMVDVLHDHSSVTADLPRTS